MIHGRNLILAIGGVPIAGSKGCTVDRDTDTIEVCSPTDGAARTYIPGTTGWSASANGLYATTEKANILRQIWRNYQNGITTPIQIQYTTGNQVEKGTAILTSLQESGEVNGLMKFSIKLQGSGKLEPQYTKVEIADEDTRLVEDSVVVVSGNSWSLNQEQDGCVVLELSKDNLWRIKNTGTSPVVVVYGYVATIDDIASDIYGGHSDTIKEESESSVVIASGKTYDTVHASTGKTMLIVNDYRDPDSNAELYRDIVNPSDTLRQ